MKLEDMTADALKGLVEWLKTAGNFVMAEAPEVAREYLTWYRIDYAKDFIVEGFFIAILLWVLFSKKLWAKVVKMEDDGDGVPIQMVVVGRGVAVVISSFLFCEMVGDVSRIAKSYYAPRLVLLEEVSRLVSAHNSCSK